MRRVYVDMDGVLCDFEGAVAEGRKAEPEREYPQSRPGFYRGLAPIPGALEAMIQLSNDPQIDLWILTAPSVFNPLSYTEKRLWVEDHLGFEMCHRLIIAPDKSLLRGDVLIDDHDRGRGQERFEGKLVYFGSPAVPDWSAALAHC